MTASAGVLAVVLVIAFGVLSSGCSTASLSAEGAKVVASPNPPAPQCVAVKHVVGEGGGTFGGEFVSNDDLIEYAMNDLRNQAGEVGANYVQHDAPTLGQGDGTTTTATITGTAYTCP
jgi:Domain of unknown function (DUF4156)